jgi:hypothetical protein
VSQSERDGEVSGFPANEKDEDSPNKQYQLPDDSDTVSRFDCRRVSVPCALLRV